MFTTSRSSGPLSRTTIGSAPGESVVGGTAPAVIVKTNSGVTVLFTDSADIVGRWQNWCDLFMILSLLSLLHPVCVSLLLVGLHPLTHSRAPYPVFCGICLP